MTIKTASQSQWEDLTSKVRSSIGQGCTIPNFDNMSPVKTFTWTISDTTYRPIYEIPNTGWDYTNMDITVAYRITVTGTGIKQVCDVIDHWHAPTVYPVTEVINRTLSTSAATTGIRYLRAVNPLASYVNNTTYKIGQEIAAYDSTSRTVQVDVYLNNSTVTWNETAPAGTIYVSDTYQTTNNIQPYSTRGWLSRKPQSFVATSADVAGYINSNEPYSMQSNTLKAGEALVKNTICFLADDGKVYRINNSVKNMVCDDSGKIGALTSAYSSGGSIDYRYFRPLSQLSSTYMATTTYGTLTVGYPVYLRCTRDANGKIHADNYFSTSMAAGYTWVPIGFATASNAVAMDARKPMFYTLDANGKLTHINGKEVYTNAGTITKVQANGTDVASSGVANIPAATTSKYGVTELSTSTSSTSTTLAATPSAVKAAYDLANGKATITMTSTDPGEGSALAANNYVAVYGSSTGSITTSDLQDGIITPAKIDESKFGAIMLQLTSDISNSSAATIPLTTVAAQRGNITNSSGRALIGTGITMVEASCSAFCSQGSATTAYAWFSIKRDRNGTVTTWGESIAYHSGSFASVSVPSVIIPVQSGDIIYMHCKEAGKTIRAGVTTWLSVKQI
jgi:hypothetical protein